jgi:multidrug efflux pump subunit AcrA (membrane-fusion protein)
MHTLRTYHFGLLLLGLDALVSCKPKEAPAEVPGSGDRVPVQVVSIRNEPLTEYIELNAVSAFLQKNYVKANANGYLQSVNAFIGKPVTRGQTLFLLKTKEAQSLGNAINMLDSTFKFSGVNTIKANNGGYITQLNHQQGDYVQDGEQLAVISDMNSFVFLLDLPYELRPYVLDKNTVELILPDGEKLKGTINSLMPTVDPVSQTQNVVIKVDAGHPIPENLVAKVRIAKTTKTHALSLPKAAILTNETQTDFWVMKMEDSITAVKVPITKGLEVNGQVEVISPVFGPGDRILVSGNYGLPDTAKVKIVP